MHLEGSCHCGKVRFSVKAPHPYPFNLCYCSICRKTAGGGGLFPKEERAPSAIEFDLAQGMVTESAGEDPPND